MKAAPKSVRLRVGVFGRANTGKSSLVNLVTGQETSIVSPVAGTTTDVVEKSMELLPLGPITLLDTAGIDDSTEIGSLRVSRTKSALATADVAVLVLEAGVWTEYEEGIAESAREKNIPLVVAVSKTDIARPDPEWLSLIGKKTEWVFSCAAPTAPAPGSPGRAEWERGREATVAELKRLLIACCPEDFLEPPRILGDLLPAGKGMPLAVLIVPIDLQAPKGRLILPQVQTIRDALDSDAACAVVKEREYRPLLGRLGEPPDLVVCDSQIALKMVADTPAGVPCTTFSILFSRFKGNVALLAEGAARLETLGPGDRVLVAESCTHHALEDDIGRVKIPRWIRQFAGADVAVDHASGRDYPEDLERYALVVHCGGCTLTRRQMLWRIEEARARGVPVTNYGMAISVLQGVAERTLSPFPEALAAYRSALERAKGAPR